MLGAYLSRSLTYAHRRATTPFAISRRHSVKPAAGTHFRCQTPCTMVANSNKVRISPLPCHPHKVVTFYCTDRTNTPLPRSPFPKQNVADLNDKNQNSNAQYTTPTTVVPGNPEANRTEVSDSGLLEVDRVGFAREPCLCGVLFPGAS